MNEMTEPYFSFRFCLFEFKELILLESLQTFVDKGVNTREK